MKPKVFRKALDTLGMKQVEFAELLQLSDRTVRYYTTQGVPNMPTTILINLLLMGLIKPDHIRHARTYRP
jgi:DNA-binding transcriptional regulator YiaG